ncbi:hypothetical protein GIB67_003654 [Kingdonia uniflora]|uniref:DNA-directed DNA polymerase n=1 Tax=Kingdonia uniflora TaxID=39325 RepID=A0A7J7M3T1_9MAGN|nr:hypothetical protein GIB67_003654 [Kingdonia uniflora]
MPCGKPVWNGNMRGVDLSIIYGFIQAYIITPKNIDKPFLPIRDKNGTLLFPKGKFVGVYLSDELRYAQKLGYKIFSLKGYSFEKKLTPFKNFIYEVYESRLKAKKSGDDAMSYGYKILMNSLYGRFDINPKSTITEICKRDKYDEITQREKIIMGNKLSDEYYIISYIGKLLSEEYVSSKVLGLLKLECFIKEGIFLAPKCYKLVTEDDQKIIKYKGPAKNYVNANWFNSQYIKPSTTQNISVESNFRIDWENLNIGIWMLNTDGSHTDVRGGYEGLVRNHGGTVFCAYHGMNQPSSVAEQMQPPSRSMSSSLNPMEQSFIPSPIHVGGPHEHFDTLGGEEVKASRERNKINRSKMLTPHTTGRNGVFRVADEMMEVDPTITRSDSSLVGHAHSDGTFPTTFVEEK